MTRDAVSMFDTEMFSILWSTYKAKRLNPGNSESEAKYRGALEMYLAFFKDVDTNTPINEVTVSRALTERWYSSVAVPKSEEL